ncbi:hypothetical protein T11_11915 [Trichinella zimbabwensis]|uniref:Uncharacterized protein n=1 Tax=Trichinella zimbabwensis TaxID=268475 RepID=A0A0V1GFB1_9BILA|nr:hypothetical protein T11_11915 [Trichinella zimbabwensis]
MKLEFITQKEILFRVDFYPMTLRGSLNILAWIATKM